MIIASIVISAAAIATSLASAYYARQARRHLEEAMWLRDGRPGGYATPPNAPEPARTAELPIPPMLIGLSGTKLSPAMLAALRRELAKALGQPRAPH